MAMRELVEGECGGANPLMKFVSHFTQDKSLTQAGLGNHIPPSSSHPQDLRSFHEATERELVGEYFNDLQHHYGAPQTFRMDSLLHEINQVEAPGLLHPVIPGTDVWTEEYLVTANGPEAWIEEYEEDEGHAYPNKYAEPAQAAIPTKWASEYLENLRPADLSKETITSQESSSKEVKDASSSLLDCAEDPRFANSKVIDVQSGKEVKSGEESDRWVDEYEATISNDEYQWLDEYTAGEVHDDHGQTAADQTVKADGDFWGKLEEEWYNLARDNIDDHPWLAEYTAEKDYAFEENNPMMEIPNPFEEGLKKLKEGDIISAILLFEAEVQQRPDHAEAWQYLGTSQSENEQDNLAIPALNKCLNLQPDNLTALMAVAVCYTNESLQSQACDALKLWLSRNPKYSSLLATTSTAEDPSARSPTLKSSMMSNSMYNEVRELYIKAAQLAPHNNIDAEVQIGLGVLFNLSGEYDKAVDCFHAALHTNPQDALVWNKLGATLANGGRSEEAVDAYRHALELSPGYVRARYNLGISCVNLKVFREAVEHFLTSLNIQRKGVRVGRDSTSTMSESIWTTLRMSLSLMGRPEFHEAVDNRDLDYLNGQFNIHIIEEPS